MGYDGYRSPETELPCNRLEVLAVVGADCTSVTPPSPVTSGYTSFARVTACGNMESIELPGRGGFWTQRGYAVVNSGKNFVGMWCEVAVQHRRGISIEEAGDVFGKCLSVVKNSSSGGRWLGTRSLLKSSFKHSADVSDEFRGE